MFGLLGGSPEEQLAIAAGLLSGTGNVGANLSQGLLAAAAARRQNDLRKHQALQDDALRMQMEQQRRQYERQQQVDALAPKYFQPADNPEVGPGFPGRADFNGYSQALMGIDPMRGMALQSQIANMTKPDLATVAPGGALVDKRTGKPVFTAPDKLPPGMVQGPNGPQYMDQYIAGQRAIREAGATRVQTNVASYMPASEEAQKEFMKATRTNYEALRNAPSALQNIEKAKELVPQASGFMGPGGSGMLEAAKFLNNRLGMSINTTGVKSAEELRTRIFQNIMDNLKKMDAQPSEMQQKMMMDALGNLGTDPTALPNVLDAFAEIIRGKVAVHNQEVTGATQRGVKFPYDPVIKLERPTPQGLKGVSIEDINAELRRRGHHQ